MHLNHLRNLFPTHESNTIRTQNHHCWRLIMVVREKRKRSHCRREQHTVHYVKQKFTTTELNIGHAELKKRSLRAPRPWWLGEDDSMDALQGRNTTPRSECTFIRIGPRPCQVRTGSATERGRTKTRANLICTLPPDAEPPALLPEAGKNITIAPAQVVAYLTARPASVFWLCKNPNTWLWSADNKCELEAWSPLRSFNRW